MPFEPFEPPESLNLADWLLDARVREGKGERTAVRCGDRRLTYREVQALADRFGNVLRALGVEPEQRAIVALPDGPEFVGALFGALKIGAVAVMVNPQLPAEEIAYFYAYTRARVAVVGAEAAETFRAAAERGGAGRHLERLLVVGTGEGEGAGAGAGAGKGGGGVPLASFEEEAGRVSETCVAEETHRDDPAIWLFSGGTTGRPKAVVQTHASFAYTTECYAKGTIGYRETDVTLSVPKLYFGYATGSNLFFPFSVGATTALFPEKATADELFAQVRRHRPTILINVPTMINHMVSHPEARSQDLSCLRLATSAGEALPPALHGRWMDAFGVELLDGLGTAEQWHIFLTNRPGDVRPGTIGKVVRGFEVKLCDADGAEVARGEPGALWVRGGARAIQYWQQMRRTQEAFRGEWYVSGDLLRQDEDGYYVYCGRADDMLKVGGKWLSPQELEDCLLRHAAVKEVAVVGVPDRAGLTKPHAFVVARDDTSAADLEGLDAALKQLVKERLEPWKYPREVVILAVLPRTHLGKVDRGKLRAQAQARAQT